LLPAFCVILAVSAVVIAPIAVGGVITWGGLSVVGFYGYLKFRTVIPRRISFYEDRVEIVGPQSAIFLYSDVESVYLSGFTGAGTMRFRGLDQPVTLGLRPRSGTAKAFYLWLSKRLESTGATVNLPEAGPREWSPILTPTFVGLVTFFGLLVGASFLLGFSMTNLPLAAVLAFGPSAAAFLYLLRRIAVGEDRRLTGELQTGHPGQEKRLTEEVQDLLLGTGARVIAIVLGLEIVGLFVVTSLPFLPGENVAFQQQQQQIRLTLGTTPFVEFIGIFSNNLHVALLAFVPYWGALSEASATYNTARLAQVIAASDSRSPQSLILALLLLPHTWVELSAYAVAVAEGVHLALLWTPYGQPSRRVRTTPVIDQFAVLLAVVAGMLVLAAALEVTEPLMADPYVLWLVVAAILAPLTLVGLRRWNARHA